MTNAIRLYNTLGREKQAFEPQDPSRVTLYVCGPTVYNRAHIGNFRPVIVFDVLFRLLRHVYGEEAVIFARNITDVEDKIIAASLETGEPIDHPDLSDLFGEFTNGRYPLEYQLN